MKQLLSGVALAALLTAGVPALAQTSTSDKQPPAAQSGTSATGASTSMPAGTDSAQSATTTGATPAAPAGPAKKSKAPGAADAQSGTSATGAKTSVPAGTDSAQSGATMPSDSTGMSSKRGRSGAAAKHESSASDNMASELNRQELQRVQRGQTTGSGQSQAPGGSGSSTSPNAPSSNTAPKR
jgi:hypothetical protein